jgi:prepilin-type N-terminal cleavage/methylation domain-containing protein
VTVARARRTGFTLLELTVVLSIIVILSGIVIVRVDGWSSGQRLRAAARTLGGRIRATREKARLEERTCVLTMEFDTGSYRIQERPGQLSPGVSFSRVTVAGQPVSSPAILSFDSRGVIPESQITLAGEHHEILTLTLKALENAIEYTASP